MDAAALDTVGGIKLARTTFRVEQNLMPGTWRVESVGFPVSNRTFIHASDPLNSQRVGAIRDELLPPDAKELLILVAPDLRDRLRDIIEGIEATERRERIEDDEEQLDDPKRLTFSGKVSIDDDGTVLIGDDPVLAKIEGNFRSDLVEVYLGAERQAAVTVAGEVEADSGFEGSDVTPAEPPRIEVGNFDLLGKLNELEGHHVELVIREVERPPSFVIEVDPRLPEGKWITPNPRFSALNRSSSELTGDKLVELVDTEASPIVVSFSMHSRVKTAIDGYQAIERNTRRVLPLIEVVPGKGRATGTVTVNVDTAELVGKLSVESFRRLARGLGLDYINLEEIAAAQRAVAAHRDGKLLIVIDPGKAKIIASKTGPPAKLLGLLVEDEKSAWRELLVAIADAEKVASMVRTEDVEDIEYLEWDEATNTISTLYESEDLSVYVDSSYSLARWRLGEGISPGSRRVGGFTNAAVQKALNEHYKKLTVSEDLRPNAEAFLASLGIALVRHQVGGEKPEPTASEKIVDGLRATGKMMDALASKASVETRTPSAFLWGSAVARELNMARDRLIEALGWAERHNERAEAMQDKKAKSKAGAAPHFGSHITFYGEDDAPASN